MTAWITKHPLLAVALAAGLGAGVGVFVNRKTGIVDKVVELPKKLLGGGGGKHHA